MTGLRGIFLQAVRCGAKTLTKSLILEIAAAENSRLAEMRQEASAASTHILFDVINKKDFFY